jgi:hypothetical protein
MHHAMPRRGQCITPAAFLDAIHQTCIRRMTASPTLRLSLSIAFGNSNSWARRHLVSQSFGGGAASVESVVGQLLGTGGRPKPARKPHCSGVCCPRWGLFARVDAPSWRQFMRAAAASDCYPEQGARCAADFAKKIKCLSKRTSFTGVDSRR